MSDHINTYTKLLMNVSNLNVMIDDKDKTLILLSSLSDEGYETFVLTLINGRISLSHKKVIIALVNLELRRKDKESSGSTSAKLLSMGRASPNQRKGSQLKSKSKTMVGNRSQCSKNWFHYS